MDKGHGTDLSQDAVHQLERAVVTTIAQVVVKEKLLYIFRAGRYKIWLEGKPDDVSSKAMASRARH